MKMERRFIMIKITPIFKSDALFAGHLYIEDSTWALKSVDLSINSDALMFCNDFNIIQNYNEIKPGVVLYQFEGN